MTHSRGAHDGALCLFRGGVARPKEGGRPWPPPMPAARRSSNALHHEKMRTREAIENRRGRLPRGAAGTPWRRCRTGPGSPTRPANPAPATPRPSRRPPTRPRRLPPPPRPRRSTSAACSPPRASLAGPRRRCSELRRKRTCKGEATCARRERSASS